MRNKVDVHGCQQRKFLAFACVNRVTLKNLIGGLPAAYVVAAQKGILFLTNGNCIRKGA